ncbi:MAG: signal peptidase I [Ruminococcaceae bacterium]|nr:signal peptidase I [Oscillospiraceae bacterium]
MNVKKVFKKAGEILGAVVIVVEVVTILLFIVTKMQGGVPSLFGYNMYVIKSGSMKPELDIDDVIISRVYDGEELCEGDVVQYVSKSGEKAGEIITHQIVSIEGSGYEAAIRTKGLANSEADPPIKGSDVIAVMKHKAVLLDDIYKWITHPLGFVFLVICPMLGMIIYEIVSIVRSIRKETEEIGKGEDNNE